MKAWIRAIVLTITAILFWFIEIVINPSDFELILALAATVCSILSICFIVIAVAKQIKSKVSGYVIFAWTDGIISIAVTIYAIYDMLTDTGWFAGIVGMLLLIFAVPAAVLLLAADLILYRINKNKSKNK